MSYRELYQTRQTPQAEPIPGREADMAKNAAGGFAFPVDDWTRLERFLILGSEGGTYYVGAPELTRQNAQAVTRCIEADGERVVRRIVEVSEGGTAPKNDPALFALAMCAGLGDLDTRRAALTALPRVARIGTHLFHFLEFVEGFRGWGRSLRRAVAEWYNGMPVQKLAYQAVKYQQRDGWSHRDALRLSHPDAGMEARRQDLYRWIVGKGIPNQPRATDGDNLQIVYAFEQAKHISRKVEILKLIFDEGLTREMIPTKWLTEPDIWAALMNSMPLTATIRNLGKATQVGLIEPMKKTTEVIVQRLTDQDYIHKSRLHPLAILIAMKVYAQGQGMKGSLSWSPVREIVDALDEAFHLAFANVEPTGKRILIGVDMSGSMTSYRIANTPLSCAEAAAALSMVTARAESRYHIVGYDTRIWPIPLSGRQRLDDVIRLFRFRGGGTDCALPIVYALQEKIEVDTFLLLTDNETWSGNIHPAQALRLYRERMNIPAKLVTCAMTSGGFSVADPADARMLDVVGFDTGTPGVIAEFGRD